VLANEVAELLAPRPGDVVVDATVGAGGHARRLAEAIRPDGRLLGLDVDAEALRLAEARLTDCGVPVTLHRRNFAELGLVLSEQGLTGVDVILADLGVSSMQLADPQRGFSFNTDGPLDMRMDDRLPQGADDLVNTLAEGPLADLLYHYAQERFSRRIAKRICAARRAARVRTTRQLADLVCQALGVDPQARRAKIHPATKCFQALRIAVNGELGALEKLLEQAPALLKPNGRVGIICFHSLEDGLVKRDFRQRRVQGVYELVTKRPVVAGAEERGSNPRARSAKLRVARHTGSTETGP
jgi:16S rRNA (cytosine1402-N4)-methyltransferase